MVVLMIIIAIGMIGWLILSAIYNNCFWGINFSEWINLLVTIILGFIVAYILAEKNTKKRRFQEAFLNKISELKQKIYKASQLVMELYQMKDIKIALITSMKDINNAITLLEKYKDKMQIVDEIGFIRMQFIEYKTLTTECVDRIKQDSQLREKADVKLKLILGKLDEIELKLCE